jgi:hypothetical protein
VRERSQQQGHVVIVEHAQEVVLLARWELIWVPQGLNGVSSQSLHTHIWVFQKAPNEGVQKRDSGVAAARRGLPLCIQLHLAAGKVVVHQRQQMPMLPLANFAGLGSGQARQGA